MTNGATFHQTSKPDLLACDECGAAVSKDDRDRQLHTDWHAGRDKAVIDLTRSVALEVVREAS